MATVAVLLFRDGERVGSGPPAEVGALPDGSPPPQITVSAHIVTAVLRRPPDGPVTVISIGDIFTLTPHQPRAAGAVYRYNYTGSAPQ